MKKCLFLKDITHLKVSESLRGLSEGLKQEKEPYKELQRASEWTWRAHCPPGYIFL